MNTDTDVDMDIDMDVDMKIDIYMCQKENRIEKTDFILYKADCKIK
jgi:hypothetical protein